MLRLVLLAVLVPAAGCGGPAKPARVEVTSDPMDRVDIKLARPPSGSPLVRGTTATIRFSLTYELVGADTGTIVLVVQDQLDRPLQAPQLQTPTVTVTRGKGSAEITHTFEVPSSTEVTAVRVYLSLFVGGSRSSQQVALAQYPVR